MFPFPFLHRNETGMGPEGHVSNHNLSTIMLRLLFQCCVAILRKDNLTWCVRGALLLTRRLFPRVHLDLFAQELQKFVRRCAQRFAIHPSLDLALCIAVPEGHGLGGMRQFLGSHEGGPREGKEERNAHEAGRREMLVRAPA